MSLDLALTLAGFVLTLIGAVAGTVSWTNNRIEGAARSAREYVDEAVRSHREQTREVYARREDLRAMEARLDGIFDIVRELHDELIPNRRRTDAHD